MKKWIISGVLLLSYFNITWGQEVITLQLTDPVQSPLAGASLMGYPDQWILITDAQGEATIPKVDSLQISYLGLNTLTYSWADLLANNGQIQLLSSTSALPTVVVSEEVELRDLSQAKGKVSALTIQRAQVSSPAAALAADAGLFVQMSQLGGGSPIVRGFEANRVLLLVDDIRMNNAIYRNGHLQNAITVDENTLSEILVTYGPGSLPYGSDALGGVVHFKTKNPLPLAQLSPKEIQWNGQAGWRFGTAANEQSIHANISYQKKKWSGFTALSWSDVNDLRAGANRKTAFPSFGLRQEYIQTIAGRDSIFINEDPNRQIASGFQQIDLLQKLTFQINPNWQLGLNLQYSTSSDIPRYDRLTQRRNGQLRFAEWYYGPQNRLLLAAQLQWKAKRNWADHARLILSRQWIAEDRYDRSLGAEWREASLVDVQVNNLTLDFTKKWTQQHLLNYGLDARYDGVSAEAFRTSVQTGEEIRDINSRYPSQGSSLASVGAYLQYRYTTADSSWLVESGGRINQQQVRVQFGADDPIQWPAIYMDGISGSSAAATWASGLSYRHNKWALRGHIATGFRSPNVDDFAKFRERNGFIQVPNPELQAEQSLSTDLSIGRWLGSQTKLSITGYRTWLRNAIVREKFQLPNGDSFFLNRGDTLFVQANVNAAQARLWGLDIVVDWKSRKTFSAKGQVHYTYGRRDFQLGNSIVEVPLDHIPPLYGQVDLRYGKGLWEVSFHWQFQLAKALDDYAVASISTLNDQLQFDRTGTPDNLEQTPLNNTEQTYAGSYAWSAFHFRASFRILPQLRLRAQVNNIADLHYRTFSSGISAAGRNLVVGVYGYF